MKKTHLLILVLLSSFIVACYPYSTNVEPQTLGINALAKNDIYTLDVTVERSGSYELSLLVYSPKRRKSKVSQEKFYDYFKDDVDLPSTFKITTVNSDTGEKVTETVSTHPFSGGSYYGRRAYIQKYGYSGGLQQGRYTITIECLETDPYLNNFGLEFIFSKQHVGK
ncbi:DUF5625 family protein [Psychrobacter fjordensis]|uniref:DUF5625 family protein n=1 Tax=Psychrobacter fjordensis TaxID=664424 RepID=UPI0019196D26|nr:DUF5625 family protein [Psychrobacter fjordensis]